MPRFSQSGQEAVQALLIQQGVAAGQQEAVEIAGLGEALAGLPLVQPGADRLDDAFLAQLQQGGVGAFHGLA